MRVRDLAQSACRPSPPACNAIPASRVSSNYRPKASTKYCNPQQYDAETSFGSWNFDCAASSCGILIAYNSLALGNGMWVMCREYSRRQKFLHSISPLLQQQNMAEPVLHLPDCCRAPMELSDWPPSPISNARPLMRTTGSLDASTPLSCCPAPCGEMRSRKPAARACNGDSEVVNKVVMAGRHWQALACVANSHQTLVMSQAESMIRP